MSPNIPYLPKGDLGNVRKIFKRYFRKNVNNMISDSFKSKKKPSSYMEIPEKIQAAGLGYN